MFKAKSLLALVAALLISHGAIASQANSGTPSISGDVSIPSGSTTATLATVNSNVGSFGGSNAVPVLTLDGKGRVTAASTAATVGSFNGRTGTVTPTSGDYTVSQVTGAAPLASPIFTGTVTIPSGALISGFAPLSAPTFTGSLNGASATWSGVDTALNFAATGTSANTLPVGTTGQRPSGIEGNIRDNTALGQLEVYIGGGWQQIVSASNGLVNLVSQVSGVLSVANGGTGASAAMQENGIFVNGDSRASNIYTDTQGLTQNPYSPLNFANSLLGEPFNIIGDAGLSGTRTDQLFTGGAVLTGTISAGGSSYTSGTYYNVNMTGGSGSGFRANIVVSGGAVTSVTPITNANYTAYNTGSYLVGDVLSASASSIGGTGSGFTYTVATIQTQMAAALASNARNLWLQDGVNDIGQAYPSASTSGTTACSNIKNYVSQAVAAGKRVFLIEEYGSTSDGSTQLGQLAILRQCEEEYARANVGNLILIDLAPIIYSPTNTSTTALTFNANYSTDGTHLNNYGAYYAGSYIKNILQTILPNVPAPSGAVAAYQDVSAGGPQLASNPIFINTSTITGVTGITGTGPTNWTWAISSGSPTATVTMQTNTDTIGGAAIGKEAVVNLTCDAAGSKIRVYNGPNNSSWSLTGKYYSTGGYYVEPGSSNFGGVALELDIATNVTTNPAIAMYAYGNVAGTANGYSGRLLTPTNFSPIGSATQSYLSEQYELYCAGAGAAVVHLRPTGVWTVI